MYIKTVRKKNNYINFCQFILILSLIIFFIKIGNAENSTIYYYNPDSISPLPAIQEAIQIYFKIYQPFVKFQTLPDINSLKKLIIKQKLNYIIISPLLKKNLSKIITFNVLNIPILQNNTNSYLKLILANNKKTKKAYDLKEKIIAIKPYGTINDVLVNNYYLTHTGHKSSDVDIVWITKELDIISILNANKIATGIVLEENYNLLKKTRPNLIKNIKVIYTTAPIPAPCLYSIDYGKKILLFIQLQNLFKEMHLNKPGKDVLNKFGIKAWTVP